MSGADRARLMAQLMGILRARTGMTLTLVSSTDADQLAEAAIKAGHFSGLAELVMALQGGMPLPDGMVRALVVGETYFQRHSDQLAFVRDTILPDIAKGGRITVVSAGCSTGEEAYSLAILLHEAGLGERSRVVGMDISAVSLAAARTGRYRAWSLRDCSDHFVASYFRRHGDTFEVLPFLRERVEFGSLNLAQASDPGWAQMQGADLVLCRNVLIYMGQDQAHRIAARMIERLRVGGWLLTGPSDPPLPRRPDVHEVIGMHGVAYHRRAPDAKREEPAPRPFRRATARPPATLERPGTPRFRSAHKPAESPHAHAVHARPVHTSAKPAPPPEPAPRVERWVQRVQVAADERGPRAAEELVREGLREHPLAAELHFSRAALRVALFDPAGAIEALERVLFLDRKLAFAHFTLCALYKQAGRVPEARRAGRAALTLLRAMAADQLVPYSGGERAGTLEARLVERLASLGGEA